MMTLDGKSIFRRTILNADAELPLFVLMNILDKLPHWIDYKSQNGISENVV
ncbi:hypothetical protein [Methyloglobulus sp.]|uniref:hypothetical protein n=1 Tax=Methyloglobulus sp. TaxID=2518622 RepID=UPI0039890212